jgi:hypothetical protein
LPVVVGRLVGAGVCAVLAVNLVAGLSAYRASAADGRRLLRAFDAAPRSTLRKPLVVAPLPDHGGLSVFIEIDEKDLGAALALRYGLGLPYPPATLAPSDASLCDLDGAHYRLRGARLVSVDC